MHLSQFDLKAAVVDIFLMSMGWLGHLRLRLRNVYLIRTSVYQIWDVYECSAKHRDILELYLKALHILSTFLCFKAERRVTMTIASLNATHLVFIRSPLYTEWIFHYNRQWFTSNFKHLQSSALNPEQIVIAFFLHHVVYFARQQYRWWRQKKKKELPKAFFSASFGSKW